ncbi:MAG: hypothetical protein N2738_03500 [Thermodesulfovibrionales bacterium]|nr:hypothetical protein [Thermodesulfovibrionales bacterium]
MVYEIIVIYNKSTGKTSFALMKDRKDNLSPTEEDLKTYLSMSKILMDQVGIKLKNKLADKNK